MTNSDSFLYPKSPFLPNISQSNVRETMLSIIRDRRPSPVAVSFQLAEIGIDLNRYHIQDSAWLLETFSLDISSLDIFMFGYVMAPSLIIGSFIMENYGPKEAFNRLCPPPSDDFLLKLNEYKSYHLVNCARFYRSLSNDPKKAGLLIYEYCLHNLFSSNPMYQVGIESSRINYLDLFRYIHNIG